MAWKVKASESFAEGSGGCDTLSEAFAELHQEVADSSDTSDTTSDTSNGSVAEIPAQAHIEALRMLEDAHLELRRLERQSTALTCELHLYRKSLSEQAESLAEKEALRLQTEAQAQRIQLTEQRLLEMEHERELLAHQLQETVARERDLQNRWQRVPRWIRRLLGVA